LAKAGYEISTARDGKEAMQLLERNQFDAIILDLKMPEKDGLEILEVINPKENHMCVIITTGFASPETMRQAFLSGVFDYIPKPLRAADLLARLDEGLKIRKRRLEAYADPDEQDRLKKLLQIRRKNLYRLEERRALHGELNTPIDLLNMIDAEEEEIEKIKKRLAEYGDLKD
jgi:DNA-binding NtrC family response regulator